MMRKRRRFSILRVLFWTLAGLVVALVGLVTFVQTSPGRALLASTISSLASSDTSRLSIGRIEGTVPTDMTITDVALGDATGIWLTIDRARLSWSPLALLSGVARIDLVDVNRISISRLPAPSEPDPAAQTGLPMLPVGVRLDRLNVASLDLAPAIAGAPAQLAITGRADWSDPQAGISADLDVRRIDDVPGQVAAKLNFDPATGQLAVSLKASEPAGGLVAGLANLPGGDALDLSLEGKGPLDAWQGDLKLNVGSSGSAGGRFLIRRGDAAYDLDADLSGDLSRLVPTSLSPLLSGTTAVRVSARRGDDGRVDIGRLDAGSEAFALTGSGHLDEARDTLAATLNISRLAPAAAAALAGQPLSWTALSGDLTISGTVSKPIAALRATIADPVFDRYSAARAQVSGQATLLGGLYTPLPTNFALKADLSQPTSSVLQLTGRLGPSISIDAAGQIAADNSVRLDRAIVASQPVDASFTGTVGTGAVAGKFDIRRADLAVAGAALGQDIAGLLAVSGDVDAAFDGSRLAVNLNGTGTSLRLPDARAQALLGDRVTLAGRVSRAADGAFALDGVKIEGVKASATAQGAIRPSGGQVRANIALSDLTAIDPQLTGRGEIEANLSGTPDNMAGDIVARLLDATASGRPIGRLELATKVTGLPQTPQGTFTLNGNVDGKPAKGGGAFQVAAYRAAALNDLDITLGSVRASGTIALDTQSRATGRLNLKAGNLDDLSALALTKLGGSVDLAIDARVIDGRQSLNAVGSATNLNVPGVWAERVNIDLKNVDPYGLTLSDSRVDISNAEVRGTQIAELGVTGSGTAKGLALQATGTINQTAIRSALDVTPTGEGAIIDLKTLQADRSGQRLTLGAPSRIVLAGSNVRIDKLTLRANGGSLVLDGEVGGSGKLTIAARSLPLSLADIASPGLGLAGTLNADVSLSGDLAKPTGNYRVNASGIASAQTRSAGIAPLTITGEGALEGTRATLGATIRNARGIDLRVSGAAPLQVAGALDVRVTGRLDTALANDLLAVSGQTLAGIANVDIAIRGTPAAPNVTGSVVLANGRFDDPINGISLTNIQATLRGSEREINIASLSARTRNGGAITGSGRIAVDPQAGFPGEIRLRGTNAQLIASETASATGSLDITMSGPLARSPRVAGRVDLTSLEITLPDRLPFSATPIEVRHVAPPPHVRARLARERAANAGRAGATPFVATLDIAVNSPARIFVRGQGITAELGGAIQIAGTTAVPIVNGGFQMRRGTIAVLGKTLTFARGEISFPGGLDPDLDFVAEAPAGGVTAQVLVTGRPSDPKLEFSSNPTLPRDEVLSRLLFGRPSGKLTASQTVQLAQAVIQLTGGGSGGALGDLRQSLGVDALDIGGDNDGENIGVGIGKRINDNIYLGVRQGATPGSSRITVDVDVGRGVKVQGEAGADGSSAVGVGVEWDY